jgi:hypothetical protein
VKNRAFSWEIHDIIAQFMAAFDDVVIGRYNRQREERDRIEVGYVYQPKRRVVHDLQNRAQNLKLPMVAVTIGGISRNSNRSFNKIEGFTYPGTRTPNTGTATSPRIPSPVPIDITINMSIIASYQTDIDQIISNFAAYANPYITITWEVPDDVGLPASMPINSKVEWSGNINLEYNNDINYSNRSVITADTTFTVEGWLFKEAVDPLDNIFKITRNFYSNQNLSAGNFITYDDYFTLSGADPVFDSVTLSAMPEITNVYYSISSANDSINLDNKGEYILQPSIYDGSIILYGKRFDDLEYVLLSSYETIYNPLTTLTGFEYFPDVNGSVLPLSSYRVITDNVIEIILPAISAGSFDIITTTAAGWSTTYDTMSGNFIKQP